METEMEVHGLGELFGMLSHGNWHRTVLESRSNNN